jgi:DNA modification methylase
MVETELFNGNNEKVLTHLDQKYRCVVTSPPYNRDIKYDLYGDKVARDIFLAYTKSWADKVWQVTKNDGCMFVNYGSSFESPLFSYDMAKFISVRTKWNLKTKITWIKENPIYYTGKGNLTNATEEIFLFSKQRDFELEDPLAIGVPHTDKYFGRERAGRRKDTDYAKKVRNGRLVRDRGNFWYFDYEDKRHTLDVFQNPIVMKNQNTNKSWELHPARFPLELPAACIAIATKENDWVLDPFVGSGTTVYAAKKMNRNSTGIDLSQTYISAARDRLDHSNEVLPDIFPKEKKKDRQVKLF